MTDRMLSSLMMCTAMGQNQIFSAVKEKSGLTNTAVGYAQESHAYKVIVPSCFLEILILFFCSLYIGCADNHVQIVGSSSREGRVQYCYQGEWGSISACNSTWSDTNAEVVCRNLTLGTGMFSLMELTAARYKLYVPRIALGSAFPNFHIQCQRQAPH